MHKEPTPEDDVDAEIEAAFDTLRAQAAEVEARRLQMLGPVVQWLARPREGDEDAGSSILDQPSA